MESAAQMPPRPTPITAFTDSKEEVWLLEDIVKGGVTF